MCRLSGLAFVAAAALGASAAAPQNTSGPEELAATIGRIGNRVQEYYTRAQSILALETVRIRRQTSDMTQQGSRELVYELHVEWTPPSRDGQAAPATIVRELISVDGRPPKPGDDEACMDPEPLSPEPMVIFLPGQLHEYAFTLAGRRPSDGRAALIVDYRSRVKGPADIKWRGQCVSVSLPGWSRGRVWVDASTYDVLRLDEELVGMFEIPVPRERTFLGGPSWLIVERSDSSIRYQAVTFRDPDETLMLPRSIETTTVWRNAPATRVRTMQVFSKYRRFVVDSRIVPREIGR